MKINLKKDTFSGIEGKLRIAALGVLCVSLVAFFLPICFEWNSYSNYVVNYFIAAINCHNKPIFASVLTAISIVFAGVLVFTKNHFYAFITGVLNLILFIILLVLIPDKSSHGHTQIAIRAGAYISPVMAVIGSMFSFLTFLKTRKKK